MIIAIDFDETIVRSRISYKGGKGYVKILGEIPHAINVIQLLKDEGHDLILWTCRGEDHVKEAMAWLKEKHILKCFSKINQNLDAVVQDPAWREPDTRKIFADVYIDDRNVFGFPGWLKVKEVLIENAKRRTKMPENVPESTCLSARDTMSPEEQIIDLEQRVIDNEKQIKKMKGLMNELVNLKLNTSRALEAFVQKLHFQ